MHFDPIFLIQTYSHFFKVTRIQPTGRKLLEHFLQQWIHRGFKPTTMFSKNQVNNDKLYGFYTKDMNEYRFHIGQLQSFQHFCQMKGFGPEFYTILAEDKPTAKTFDVKIREGWVLRDKQPEVVDFIIKPTINDGSSRLVTMATGQGKTFSALWATCKLGKRTAIIILPVYLNKWRSDIKEITDCDDSDIMTVQGSDYLRGLIELGKEGTYRSDFVLISMTTWFNYLKSYGENPSTCVHDEYGCKPEDVYKLLGIGTVIIDEIHQHLHHVYRTFCFMNVDLAIGLSATFVSEDRFINDIQHVMFPKEIRFEGIKMKKYILGYGISYSIRPDRLGKIKTTERGNTSYSQNAYERSILKHNGLLGQYLELVNEVVRNGYLDQYKPGRKCIIFNRTVTMCEKIVEFLKRRYPHLDIRKYTEGDPWENVIEPDIRVTTQKSAGTAVDIPGLITNITLDNVRSVQSNMQCLGRLREPKDEAIARYYSVFSESIPKQSRFHYERKKLLEDRVVGFKDFKSNIQL